MTKSCIRLIFLFASVSLLGACGYQHVKLNYADISAKRKMDLSIESIIVEPAAKETSGLITSIKDTKPSDDDNRIYQVKKMIFTQPTQNGIQ